jgi:CheY-like chemotaxis protein
LIRVDKAEFELALVIIALNARDAMPSGGLLAISCENQALGKISSPDGLSGDFVAFKIADTGCGIPASFLRRVFDPFLRLKSRRRVARRSGGSVVVDSEVERGTTITIYLPRSHEPVRSANSKELSQSREQRDETVLVVEDNTEVRAVATTLLHELGYRTIEAESAASALEELDSGIHVDLVFSDIVLSGSIDGISLAQEVSIRFPGIPILLTTGYARRMDAELKHQVLRKPYDVLALDRAVRRAIDTYALTVENAKKV